MAGQTIGSISIKVTPDTSNFRRDLKRELESVDAKLDIKTRINRESFRDSMLELKTRLSAQTPKLKIKTEIDRSVQVATLRNFVAAMSKAGEQAGETFSNGMNTGIKSAGGFSRSGLAGAAVLGGLGALIASLLAPAIGIVSTALAGLPGLITAVATPVGVLALGMDGLKKAAEQLKPQVDQLKAVMSKKTEDVFTPILSKVKDLFPTLTAQLPKVTDGLGQVAKSIVDTVTSAQGLDRVRWSIGNIAAGLQAAAPGMGSVASGITGLATAFSAKLPAIGQWITEIGAQFDKWVTKVTSNGQLSTAFDNLGAAIKPVVGLIGDLVAKGIDWMSDPKFGQALVTTLTDIRDAVNATMTVLGPMFQMLSATLTTILSPLRLFTGEFEKLPLLLQVPIKLVDNLFTSIKDKLTGIDWAGIWTGLTTTASTAWEAVKQSASDAWNTMVSGLTGAVEQIVSKVSELPGKIATALAGMAKAGWDAGVQLVQGMINGIGSLVGSLVDRAKSLATSALNAVKSALDINSPSRAMFELGQFTGQGLADGISSQIKVVGKAAEGLADQIKNPFVDLQNYMNHGVSFAKANMGQLITDLGGSGNGALEAVMSYGVDAAQSMVQSSVANNQTYNFNTVDVDGAFRAWRTEMNR
ncbi:hypothetical protein, partial [Mycolicibacterium llatzerense]|uniref:phage tail protein n=1 Tax=Mycolicibacterium llatzerense TaxID=280871 RepID=UPI0008DE7BEC